MNNFFQDHIKLLSGSIYLNISENDSSLILDSFFNDEYWSFIVLKNKFETEKFNSAISIWKDLLSKGKKFSLYINRDFNNSYLDSLTENGFEEISIDTYIFKNITQLESAELNSDEEFSEVGNSTETKYIEQAKLAFPEWDNEEFYTKYFIQKSNESSSSAQENNSEKGYKNFVIKNSSDIITFGSLIYSKELNLAYIHNSGTNEKFRRQGYFSKLNNLMMNFLLNQGITRIYAMAEEGGNSYNGFLKQGFVMIDKFHIYFK